VSGRDPQAWAREVARAEVRALTDAMMDAVGVTLYAPDLPPDAIGKGLQDVVEVFTGEIDRRIPGWVSPEGTGTDPEVPTDKETGMELSEQDRKAIELSKMVRGNPELKERVRKVDEARAGKEPVEKMHPVSKVSEDSPVLADYEGEILAVMSKDRCSHEVAIGKLARDPAYHDLKTPLPRRTASPQRRVETTRRVVGAPGHVLCPSL
jgi:hypothetical protein